MSRRERALIATAFTYVQWVLSAFAGLFVTRFMVRTLGNDLYGMWLATGALLAYAALADLGILGVMPWLFAEAEGAKNTEGMRSLMVHGLAASLIGGTLYILVAIFVWALLPGLLHLSLADRNRLLGPVAAMTLFTAFGYFTRLFTALRIGLQDYSFMGALGIAQILLNLGIVVGLTLAGAGLYGIAIGTALPPIVTGGLAWARTFSKDRHLLRKWPRLTRTALRPIVTSGAGQWLSSLGWQMAFASDAVVIAYLGHRDLVPVFVVTSRLGLTLMQFSWALPDNSSVGLAQLKAEGAIERSGQVVAALLRFHLLTAGLIACGVLAGNFGFVTGWIGRDLFGGAKLNTLVAIDVMVLSVVHGLMVPIAVLGRRITVGILTLLNGCFHVILALALGYRYGLAGVAAATALSALITTIPGGVRVLVRMSHLTPNEILVRIGARWLLRLVPCSILAIALGWTLMRPEVGTRLSQAGALVAGVLAGIFAGFVYLLLMRPLTRELPLGARLQRALLALHLT